MSYCPTLTKNKSVKLLEIIVILYIVLSPINNAIETSWLSLLSLINIALFAVGFLTLLINWKIRKPNFLVTIFYVVFLIEFFISYFNRISYFSYLISFSIFFLFCCNFGFNKKRIISAIYISSLISSIICIIYGFSNGVISRTGVLASGNIGVVAVCTALFFDNESNHDVWKIIGIISSLIVVFLSVSRIRIALIVVLFAVYIFLNLISKKGNKRNDISLIFFALIVLCFLFFIFSDEFTKLLKFVFSRFVNFAEDEARDEEIRLGLQFFNNNKMLGIGWTDEHFVNYQGSHVMYCDHCSYVAVLAHGGILLAFPFVCCIFSFVKKGVDFIKQKEYGPLAFLCCFLVLMYTSAGLTNYSSLILLFMFNQSIRRD